MSIAAVEEVLTSLVLYMLQCKKKVEMYLKQNDIIFTLIPSTLQLVKVEAN